MQERWAEIQAIWKSNQILYIVAGFMAGILFFPAIEALSTDASQLLSGFVPEAVGIAFTVLLIDRLYQRREYEREERELKTRLVREAGSTLQHVAIQAISDIRARGWLTGIGSILQKADFRKADLRNVNLRNANLQRSISVKRT